MGRVFVTGQNGPGLLYQIDPTQPAGAATIAATGLGTDPNAIAFDGAQIWTANNSFPGSISVIAPGPTQPWPVTNITTGFIQPLAIFYDGSNIWVVDGNKLKKLDSSGNTIQTITVGLQPSHPAFDGINIWVPNFSSHTITVIRASTGTILATLNGNGLDNPSVAAFDGERILVTNFSGDSVSVWKGDDLTPIGVFSTGFNSQPNGACSDGTHFWVLLQGSSPGKLARF
jgi:DNA-binding beta-propeller fold protein YncE